ncbi:hypothetical protein [Deinococcus enclensis]|uniref:Uncharacterized protein n=1 Tax=Deinococcus enclensis TaxID=1049582 RepID=A0ABT9MEA5_9DEIO|nr:hypothetical protein [Deinococcus enclensis]MDP9764895.1 hypothetical protein [Deinococcus enclensis]
MPITPSTKPAQPGRKRISLPLLLDQLDREWDDLQAQDNPFTTDDDRALLAYYHAAVRIGLDWIQGDYHYTFPTWYQDQRLARLCTYLKGLEGLDMNPLMDARDKQLTLLREQTWPAYYERCTPGMNHHASTGTDTSIKAELTYTWDGIDSLYSPAGDSGPLDQPLPYLPKFHSPESEAFHCNVLAVLFLNRAVKTSLCDLWVTPF